MALEFNTYQSSLRLRNDSFDYRLLRVMAFYNIRPIEQANISFILDSLYHFISVTEGKKQPSKEILNNPEIAKYGEDWGHVGGEGFIAALAENQQPIGAAWYRLFQKSNPGYGYVDETTPELSIAILPHDRSN